MIDDDAAFWTALGRLLHTIGFDVEGYRSTAPSAIRCPEPIRGLATCSAHYLDVLYWLDSTNLVM
ncbi:hypothetical protein [Labrys miyagiensis]|uniref:hypothetical protein n=1 Tax=Labrys miyagiensis TaxID=346912 RepID=UPI0024E156F9|nr:hypothetical protein [Labrys miyagiensis]